MSYKNFVAVKKDAALPPRRRRLLALAALMLCYNVCAQNSRTPADSSTFTFTFEHDLFGDTAAQYTNGIQIGWQYSDLEHYHALMPKNTKISTSRARRHPRRQNV